MDHILYFDYNQKSSVLLIFLFNALVFSFLLFKNGIKENRNDSKWLAFFLLLCGLYICPFMFGYAGWYSKQRYREFLFFVPFQQLFLVGPVFFFYTKSLLNKSFKLRNKALVHFAPAVLYLLYSLVVFITDKWVLDEFYFYADGRDKDLSFWYQMSGLISMLLYLILSLNYYRNYRKVTLQEVSYADEISFNWVKHFMLAFSVILILRVLFFILNPEWGEFGSKYWYYLCFSILFLYVAFTGYANAVRTSVYFPTYQANLPISLADDAQGFSVKESIENKSFFDSYENSLIQLFDREEVYKNQKLTLTDVATQLGTNRNIISQLINNKYGTNFNDFVNGKRIEAVIKKLQNKAHHQFTLLAIALDCGFNSKTTFNRAFKKATNLSPKQYILKNKL